MRRTIRYLALAATLSASLAIGGTAFGAPAENLSFLSGGGGSTAHWNQNQQSVTNYVALTTSGTVGNAGPVANACGSPGDRTTLGDYAYGCGYTKIVLHHFADGLPTQEPTFTTDFYAAGTPRWYILMSNGNYMFGYPDGTAPNGFSWEAHVGGVVSYGPWGTESAAVTSGGGTVSEVRIVSDASAPTPYTATISQIEYAGQYPTP